MDIQIKAKYINVIDNHIYFYGPVDDYTTPVAIEAIHTLNNSIKKTKKIDKTYNNDDIFVYGSKVDDFHTLDKSYIYIL